VDEKDLIAPAGHGDERTDDREHRSAGDTGVAFFQYFETLAKVGSNDSDSERF
jgi:hypothetical protein